MGAKSDRLQGKHCSVQQRAKKGCAVNRLRSIAHTECAQDGDDVGFDGHIRNPQLLANGLVRLALDQLGQNLALAW